MLIHFIHPGRSYLPELAAYSEFLQQAGHAAAVHTAARTVPENAEVLWWFCGLVPRRSAQRHAAAFQIHEYASTSTPPWGWLKDRFKAKRQPVPQYRIFQNAWVRDRLDFADAVPFEYRDMGVPSGFLGQQHASGEAEFDFVYLGSMQRLRSFGKVLRALQAAGRTLLLIGDMPHDVQSWLRLDVPSACSMGRVPQSEVPGLLRRARFGLNLVPVKAPYAHQTSTKLLEYCAAGLPVVSTDYPWVRQFERTSGGRFIYLPAHATARTYVLCLGGALDMQPCAVPSMHAHAWPAVLDRMPVWRRLGIRP